MSRLNDLIRQARLKDPALADDLEREVAALADRRAFGLNFERHTPETVELPGRRVGHGDKVRVLPPRGASPKKADERLWRVKSIEKDGDGRRTATLESMSDDDGSETVAVADLVVVAEFRDPIYPGLVSTGKVERGGDKPFHTVINAENYHALQSLLFTHRGKVDCIYIDPPYNTGAKDWKYNNDYVEGEDLYRHSKWLAFIERRLLLARELLNPTDSVMVVAIDEREGHRLGLLLEQVFPEARVQMVTSVVNPKGVPKAKEFSRIDEWLFFVMIGEASPDRWQTDMLNEQSVKTSVRYVNLKREGTNWHRADRPGLFYPIYVDPASGQIEAFGEPLPPDADRHAQPDRQGLLTIWPIKPDGSEARWQQKPSSARALLAEGLLRSRLTRDEASAIIEYLSAGQRQFLADGRLISTGQDINGALIVVPGVGGTEIPKTIWRQTSHSATEHGSKLLSALLGGRKFPFPKSLYAVEDALRFFVMDKPNSLVVDFFSGSGTTAHAVMRLNRQDGGHRRSISVTNNEVSAEEQAGLRKQGLRQGDGKWESLGICDYITKPRIEAAITGNTPSGDPIKGEYKFIDEFPMAEGFEENVEFFTLTYEAPLRVASNREFQRIAPLLWLRAGACGRRIEDLSKGWDVADSYGVIADLDQVDKFVRALSDQPDAVVAFVVTDEDRLFESIARELPEHVEPVRLYEAYLRNFEIESGRGAR
ncbi:MAG: site-specific DNA-methyltransferase [Phycicoccus sp.]|nr:site-specific DNA-methyltransferase [Phycicoccus sp.]